MSRNNIKDWSIEIGHPDDFESALKDHNDQVMVLEIYSGWFGFTSSFIPSIDQIMKKDQFSEKLSWFRMNVNKIQQEIKQGESKISVVNDYLTYESPKPLFLFIKQKEIVAKLRSCDTILLDKFVRSVISDEPSELEAVQKESDDLEEKYKCSYDPERDRLEAEREAMRKAEEERRERESKIQKCEMPSVNDDDEEPLTFDVDGYDFQKNSMIQWSFTNDKYVGCDNEGDSSAVQGSLEVDSGAQSQWLCHVIDQDSESGQSIVTFQCRKNGNWLCIHEQTKDAEEQTDGDGGDAAAAVDESAEESKSFGIYLDCTDELSGSAHFKVIAVQSESEDQSSPLFRLISTIQTSVGVGYDSETGVIIATEDESKQGFSVKASSYEIKVKSPDNGDDGWLEKSQKLTFEAISNESLSIPSEGCWIQLKLGESQYCGVNEDQPVCAEIGGDSDGASELQYQWKVDLIKVQSTAVSETEEKNATEEETAPETTSSESQTKYSLRIRNNKKYLCVKNTKDEPEEEGESITLCFTDECESYWQFKPYSEEGGFRLMSESFAEYGISESESKLIISKDPAQIKCFTISLGQLTAEEQPEQMVAEDGAEANQAEE